MLATGCFPSGAADPLNVYELKGDGDENEGVDCRPDYRSTGARLITESTPLAEGFHMPGEEKKHEATLWYFRRSKIGKSGD